VAHYTEQAGFPAIPINGTMKLRLRALDPTTDAEVSGVTVSQWLIYARDESDADVTGVVPVYALDGAETAV
jgi:hypothetical protein